MRPVLLHLNGFCSYRTETQIDFRDADFFVLVGATGSGKSTVIDAMVFALYGTVPRWGERNAVAPALAPSVSRGVVRLIFDSGGKRYAAIRDVRRSGSGSVTVKEARLEELISTDSLGEPEDETVSIVAGPKHVTAAVEELLGLNYEQFTQSVALPQGEFARFLHATDGQRQLILKNLLGYGIYDSIQSAAHQRASVADTRASTLADQLESYAESTEGCVATLSDRLTNLKEIQSRLMTTLLPDLRQVLSEVSTARNDTIKLANEHEQLLSVIPPNDVDDLENRRTLQVDALKTAEDKQSAIELQDRTTREQVESSRSRYELEKLLENWKELNGIYLQLPSLNEARVASQTELIAKNSQRADAAAVHDSARLALTDSNLFAEQINSQLGSAAEHLLRVEEVVPPSDIDEIANAVREATEHFTQCESAVETAEAEVETSAITLDALPGPGEVIAATGEVDRIAASINEDIAGSEDRRSASDSVKAAELAVYDRQRHLEACELALRSEEQAHRAAAIRGDLTLGDDCPVCGQTVHTFPEMQPQDELHGAKTQLDAAKSDLANANNVATQKRSSHLEMSTVRAERVKQLNLSRTKLQAHLSMLGLTAPALNLPSPLALDPSPEDISEFGADTETIAAQLEHTREIRLVAANRRASANQTLVAARNAARDAAQAVEALEMRTRQALTALFAARDTVSALQPPAIDDSDVAAAWQSIAAWAEAQKATLTVEVELLTASAAAATAAASAAKAQLSTAAEVAAAANEAATTAALDEQRAATAAESARLRQIELSALLADAPVLDVASAELKRVKELEDRRKVLSEQLHEAQAVVIEARKALTDRETAIADSRRELSSIRDPLIALGAPQIAGKSLSDDWTLLASWAATQVTDRAMRIEALTRLLEAAEDRLEVQLASLAYELSEHDIPAAEIPQTGLIEHAPAAIASSVATAAADLNHAEEQLRKSLAIKQEIVAASESAAVAKELSNLLKVNNFPRWLISSAVDALLQSASIILVELSGGQFELVRAGSDLAVIDHTDADLQRPVKTLSGGETFQASLALALALSEQVAHLAAAGASKLESIFLDEGFGTLDDTTLDVVAGTLENLASSGSRMVGVITHVSALAERIPVRFQVTRDGSGSHIDRVMA